MGGGTTTTGTLDPTLRPLFAGAVEQFLNEQQRSPLGGFADSFPQQTAPLSYNERLASGEAQSLGQPSGADVLALQRILQLPELAGASPGSSPDFSNSPSIQTLLAALTGATTPAPPYAPTTTPMGPPVKPPLSGYQYGNPPDTGGGGRGGGGGGGDTGGGDVLPPDPGTGGGGDGGTGFPLPFVKQASQAGTIIQPSSVTQSGAGGNRNVPLSVAYQDPAQQAATDRLRAGIAAFAQPLDTAYIRNPDGTLTKTTASGGPVTSASGPTAPPVQPVRPRGALTTQSAFGASTAAEPPRMPPTPLPPRPLPGQPPPVGPAPPTTEPPRMPPVPVPPHNPPPIVPFPPPTEVPGNPGEPLQPGPQGPNVGALTSIAGSPAGTQTTDLTDLLSNDPTVKAQLGALAQNILPVVQNQANLSGLGRSTAATNAIGQAQTSALTPIYQDTLARLERAGVRRADATQQAISDLMGLSSAGTARTATGISALSQTGATGRGIQQSASDAAYADFLRKQALAENAVGVPFGAGAPSALGSIVKSSGGLFK